MDFSDIVEPPQRKPYWQILDEHARASAQEPELAKLSVPEFAQTMNEVSGTNEWDEGLNDSWVRRAGANIERGLRHFGGATPGTWPTGLPSLAETLGGTRAGWDVPAAAHELGKSAATSLGAGPELAEKIGGATETLPKTAVTVGAGAALGGLPTIAGLSALETYGESGRVLPSLVSGATAFAIPKAMEWAGQGALKAIGAKTVGELKPELAALLDASKPATEELLGKYAPRVGWSPRALVERGVRLAGAQGGMLGAGIAGSVAQTAINPDMTWSDKLKAVGEEFSPSSLVATAVGQLPFTAFDIFNERTHPLKQVESEVRADFAKRFTAAAKKGDPETGSPAFVPTMEQINRVIQGLTKGEIEPESATGHILQSIGSLPATPDLTTPVITSEAAWPMPEAVNETKQRTQRMLLAQGGVTKDLGNSYDQTIYQALRATEIANKGKASKEDTMHQAATIVVDRYFKDQRSMDTLGRAGTVDITKEEVALKRHEALMTEITDAINPESPNYNKEAHQRVALTTGDPEHWAEAGITEPVMFNAQGELVSAVSRVGGPEAEPIEVARRTNQPLPLNRNIVDKFSGMGPKPSLRADIVSRQQEIFRLDKAARALESIETPTVEQVNQRASMLRQIDNLKKEVNKLLGETEARSRGFTTGPLPPGGKPQAALFGTTTARAIERAYNYGKSAEDVKAGRVLNLKDPASVSEFINNVSLAIKRGEIDEARKSVGRASQRTLPEKYGSEAEADAQATKLNEQAAEVPGEWLLRYRAVQDRNEAWRIVEEQQARHVPFTDAEPPTDFKEQIVSDVLEQGGAEQPVTLASLGQDITELSDNVYVNRAEKLKSLTDPAERAARMEALAGNVMYYLTHISDDQFQKLVLGHAQERYGEAGNSIRNIAKLKQRMIRYVQFIRDGGKVDVKEVNGRLIAPDHEQRVMLEQYMGGSAKEGGLGFGTYPATHERAGQPRADEWNSPKVSNLNFFEQFGSLMADLRKKLPDPRIFEDAPEMLPRGDFGYLPRGFRDEVVNKLLVRWPPELGPSMKITPERLRGEYPTAPERQRFIDVRDRKGETVTLKAAVNPLLTFFTESARNQYTMPLSQLLDLFDQHGKLDGVNRAMFTLVRKLANLSPFMRDMPVGIGIAADPASKAYYHTDTLASSAGMLLSPFKEVSVREAGGRYLREMMTPNEIFPHFMNEVGHTAVDFAYLKNLGFRREIDRIFEYVNQHVQDLQLTTGGQSEWTQSPLHSLSNPREFLASIFNDNRLHQLLSTIKDPFEPLPGSAVGVGPVDNLFTRIKTAISNMLRGLFGIGPTEAATMLDRMTGLASQGFDIQQSMNLRHRGDIYHEAIQRQLLKGTNILETEAAKTPAREPKWLMTGQGMITPPTEREAPPKEPSPPKAEIVPPEAAAYEQLSQAQMNLRWVTEQARQDPMSFGAEDIATAQKAVQIAEDRIRAGEIPPNISSVIRQHESALGELQARLGKAQVFGYEGVVPDLQRQIVEQQTMLDSLRTKRQLKGSMLESRTVGEDERGIPKPIFNIAGRKGTLLRDPVIRNIVSSFTAGRDVRDAFSGSGQLSTFAKGVGANSVELNVLDPAMHSIFSEIKTNPRGFARRVSNAARLIDSRRNQIPTVTNGMDIRSYLDQVQKRDPNVGLFLKQNLSYFGREVTKETFTPSPTITNAGLSDLPRRISHFSNAVDTVSHGDGWNVVANAQRGDRVMVDPPYVTGGRSRYGVGSIKPEQRVAEYEKHLYPAAARGAEFLVFDVAEPTLMKSLVDHGFTVQPIQRTGRAGGEVRQEFVAYNHHDGQMLESRVNGQAVLDSMKSAALYIHEDPERIWFRPYDGNYFRETYGPAFGYNLRWEPRGEETGYSIAKRSLNGLTQMDLALMPRPKVESWAPSLYETLNSMFRDQGSEPETAKALAAHTIQFGALLRDTERSIWGKIGTEHATTGDILGKAWGWNRIAGLTPEATEQLSGLRDVAYTVRHENAHLVGLHSHIEHETPDVREAYSRVTDVFEQLTPEGRKAFLEGLGSLTSADGQYPGFYQKAVDVPFEFGAEFMGHVGDVISNLPKPSAYLRDEMRFAPDELSRLLVKTTLRRMQGLDKLVESVDFAARLRGVKDVDWKKLVGETAEAFKPLARSALEISFDQAEFYRMRNLYPDMYKGLLKQMSESLQTFQEYTPEQAKPELPSEILESRESIPNAIRKFFKLPDPSGNLPEKLSFWDRQLTQFGQFADKYPQARSAWDMFAAGRALYNGYKIRLHTALAGAFEGGKPTDDARTKDVHKFISSPSLRQAFDKISLDLNTYGDYMYDKAAGKAEGDVMKIDPQAVTGWLTPQYIEGLMTKYGVAEADKPAMRTILDGTRNQIKVTGTVLVDSAIHRMESAVAAAVMRVTNLPPESARKAGKLLSDAIKTQSTDIEGAMGKVQEFRQMVQKPEAFERLFDMANATWDNILTLERFLSLRMPYFMSERRPGQYGLFFKDAKDKITSRYFKNSTDRDNYVQANSIKPVRQTNPGDRDYGVSPAVFKKLDESFIRMKEKLVNVFGEETAESLATAMDIGTELRDALNSRDILKVTTGRDLSPGREELDMFAAHQQYINAVSRAAYNSFVRLETELLNKDPELSNQPMIKDYINRQVKQVLVQDSPIGRQMQNLGFLYYLWGNVSSMMLQAMDQLSGMAPILTSRGGSIAGSYNTLMKANKMLMESKFGGRYKDPEVQAAVERARRDGILGSWIARELDIVQDLPMVNRMRATTGKNMWSQFDLLKNKLYQGYGMMRRLYDTIPKYNAEVGFVASLLHLRSAEGGSLRGDALYKEAQFVKELAMYPGGKETRPGFFQHVPRTAAQSLWSLQTYANGLTTMLGELIRRSFNPKGITPAQATQARKAAAQALITQTAVAGVLGLPFAQGIVYALQKLFPEHNVELDIRQMLASLFGDDEQMGNAFSSAMAIGIPSAMDYAPDLGSRFALSGVFHVSPYSGVDWTSIVGPSGGVLSNAFQGAQAGLRGDPIKAVKSLMPVGAQRIWKSLEEGQTHKTTTGRIVVSDLRPEEIVARAIGFRPARVHRVEEFERLTRVSQDAEKAEQTRWTREQVKLLRTGQDDVVRQNIALRTAQSKGVFPARDLANNISREFERETMPVNLRSFGNRATIEAQAALRGVLGTQDEGPSNLERLQLQQTIASRLGLGGPSTAALRRAAGVDQLLSLYPHLTNAQASLLLTHAASSRPTPELYSELLAGSE